MEDRSVVPGEREPDALLSQLAGVAAQAAGFAAGIIVAEGLFGVHGVEPDGIALASLACSLAGRRIGNAAAEPDIATDRFVQGPPGCVA